MQKSIFSKYFRVCAVTVLTAFLLLGTLFMTFASHYFSKNTLSLLTSSAHVIENYIIKRVDVQPEHFSLTDNTLRPVLMTLSDSSDTIIFITDVSGKTLFCTEGDHCTLHRTYQLPKQVLEQSEKEGIYSENGRLFGYYDTAQYTVCIPIQVTDNSETAGFLFVVGSTDELHQFINEMIKIFLLCAVLVLFITFVVTYFVTLKMVRPLREMAVAAKKFGQGDFSTRIKIDTDDEIGQLAMAFNNMAKSLTGLEAMRRSFIANVSHELRTPMTSIAGFIDGILDGTIDSSRQGHYLRIVSDEVKRLSRLVRSMLNLSRIEAGELKVKTTQFNVLEVICETVFSFEKSINNKHLDIRGLDSEKVMVEADPDLIHQVVYNLIENAVKFVNEGGYLEFSFNTDNRMTYVGIRNSGEGLAKDEIPKVFDRFYKTDRSRGMDKNGVGLGLYLVRSIINLHGGDIIVKSTKGEYTEFVFSIPTAKVKNAALIKAREKGAAEK